MRCFKIESNLKIKKLLDHFHEAIKDAFPEPYENYKKCEIEKISGWPCAEFDSVIVYYKMGYDAHHPQNRHKEIEKQYGEITINQQTYKFEFFGYANIISRFYFPRLFHQELEFEEIYFSSEPKPIKINNVRAKKKFRNNLKKDIKEYDRLINYDDLFFTKINNKIYISIAEIERDRFLSFDQNREAYILNYKEPQMLEDNENRSGNFIEMSTIQKLDMNINCILKSSNNKQDLVKSSILYSQHVTSRGTIMPH